jgi:hypothetical protein
MCSESGLKIIELLVQSGANLNTSNTTNCPSVFHVLARYFPEHTDLFRLCLEKGADPNATDLKTGESVLQVLLMSQASIQKHCQKRELQRENVRFYVSQGLYIANELYTIFSGQKKREPKLVSVSLERFFPPQSANEDTKVGPPSEEREETKNLSSTESRLSSQRYRKVAEGLIKSFLGPAQEEKNASVEGSAVSQQLGESKNNSVSEEKQDSKTPLVSPWLETKDPLGSMVKNVLASLQERKQDTKNLFPNLLSSVATLLLETKENKDALQRYLDAGRKIIDNFASVQNVEATTQKPESDTASQQSPQPVEQAETATS